MAETKKKGAIEKSGGLEPLRDFIAKHDTALVEAVVTEALARRREFLVGEIASRFAALSPEHAIQRAEASPDASNWGAVESLSRLRSLVGGRFQNLKERWIGAGFPLREHRGEEHEAAAVNEQGWLELMNWISKQGFEARLTPGAKDRYFEIRKLK